MPKVKCSPCSGNGYIYIQQGSATGVKRCTSCQGKGHTGSDDNKKDKKKK